MLQPDEISELLLSRVMVINGKFRIEYSKSSSARNFKKAARSEIIIPFIKSTGTFWPFDIPPNPRNLGSLIELFRCCTFRIKETKPQEIQIIRDIDHARSLGAFDTPVPIVRHIAIAVIDKLSQSGNPPKLVDPACGAGYFLLDALDSLHDAYPGIKPVELVEKCLTGLDIDPIAVELTRRNIAWHLNQEYKTSIVPTLLEKIIIEADALADFDKLPINAGSFDGVIGNPPYQFFSGRGSPVAALRKSGKTKKAKILDDEINILVERFSESSSGCRDRYKWFIQRAIELIKPGGYLGYITPNTWLAYPRYHDIRNLLKKFGNIESVIDLGTLPFKRAHVPTAILIWQADRKSKPFPLAQLSTSGWQKVIDVDEKILAKSLKSAPLQLINGRGDIEIVSKKTEMISSCIKTLGDIAVIREGSHDIRAVARDCQRTASDTRTFPVIIDKSMGNLIPPTVGYIDPPDKNGYWKNHEGERLLIRKTGDRLVVAPCGTNSFALAHQNVYVVKIKNNLIPFLTLVGILGSDYLTEIYRSGAGGQHKRPHAQFRILFLKKLRVVVQPDDSDPGKIAESHAKIADVTEKIIKNPDSNLTKTLDKLVRDLYRIAEYNE